ncbi:unnamed protein product [Cunninghamella blakesleeana]
MHSGGGGHHSRRHSNYSNFSTMSETSLPWTTRDIGFNAISGVLNDPAKHSQNVAKSSKVDIATVPQAQISRVKPHDFDNYISHIESVFDQYQYNKLTNHNEEYPLTMNNNSNNNTPATNSTYGLQAETPILSSLEDVNNNNNNNSLNIPVHQRRSSRNPYSLPLQHVLSSDSLVSVDSSSSKQQSQRELPMLENVPSIFFDDNFQLENPRTFDTVCEGADIIGNSGPNPPISTNNILQEKLSYYLDTVEVHLLQEIENRSSSFFEALSNLQALHQQTLDCVTQIHHIRNKMKSLEKTECRDGLEIIRLQVKKRNLEKLYTVISSIKDLVSVQPMIQILLGQGDYFGALDLIQETRLMLQQPDGIVDWHAIRALVNLSTQLDEMEKAVAVMMQHDFLSVILSDMNNYVDGLKRETLISSFLTLTTSLSTIENNSNNNKHELDDDIPIGLKNQLSSSVMGLISTDVLSTSLQDYKNQLCIEIKNIIKKSYPIDGSQKEAMDSPNNNQSNGLTKQLKTMRFDMFFQMLVGLLSTLLEVIKRAAMYDHLLCKLIDESLERHILAIKKEQIQQQSDDNENNSVQNIDDLELDNESIKEIANVKERCQLAKKESSDVIYTIADLAHVRCGKLIGFRNDQNALLNPTDFYRLSNVLKVFVNESEIYCGRACYGLRGTILSQQKAFIDHFHMERIKQEAQLIENDQWVASEVPSDFQRIVDRICDGTISSFVDNNNNKDENESNEQYSSANIPEKTTKLLSINNQSYYVVGCTLLIIKLFEDYLRCVLNLKGMATDIMQKLLELLKLFNSRVCQVILGAGAMKSAGLKNISAKHLALASQSIGIMIALTPSLKNCMGKNMPPKHMVLLSEFDRIVKDFKDHQKEIYIKLIAIMNERFSVHINAMQVIQWDNEESTGKQANLYMETLVKETMTLHKVLSKYLPSNDLQFIMTQVFHSFTSQLSQEIKQLPIRTNQGKTNIHKDASYFTRRLSSLQGIEGPSNEVLEVAESIIISSSNSDTALNNSNEN